MGSQNCKELTSAMLFTEDETEEMNEWLECTDSHQRPYYAAYFPDAELRPVQPAYNNNGNKDDDSIKRSVLIVNKDYRKNRDCLPGKLNKSNSTREEITMSFSNNNITKLDWREKTTNGKIEMNRRELDESEEDFDKGNNTGTPSGRVYIAMSHDPITRRLKVAVIKAKNMICRQTLKGKDKCSNNCTASYITVSLVEGGRVIDSYTTAVKTDSGELHYYENFAFHLNNLSLRGLSVIITAKHTSKHRFLKHTHDIGKVVLNGLLVDGEMIDSHLIDVTMHPGRTLYKWHTIWTDR